MSKVLVLKADYKIEGKQYSIDLDIPVKKVHGLKDVELEVENYLNGMFDIDSVELVDVTILYTVDTDEEF